MDQATVKVVLRVKPKEGEQPSDSVTVVDDGQNASVILKKTPKSQELFQFGFLRALENASQEEVYQHCGQEIVESAVQGYNGTILAYGQTGSGKTYTMLGPQDALDAGHEVQGIMPRAIREVFRELDSKGFLVWSVKLTFVEIYNEAFRDLLMPKNVKEVTIQDTNQKGTSNITLRGVTRVEVQTEEQAMACLQKGHKSRSVSAHSMNDRSSRSHTILTLWIETTNKDGSTHRSKLNLVDLAGSERLRKTGAEGSVAKEATFINKSLSALSLVVKELKKKSGHVRYRDSKLTHYLKDSLGGNCQTLMIACIWGDDDHMGESISTCRFADDMQQVQVSAERNTGVESIHGHLFKLDPVMQKYIDSMTAKRVAEEKAKMMMELKRGKGGADVPESDVDLTSGEHVELVSLRAKVKEFELQKVLKSRNSLFGGQGDHLKEMESLRQRVVELEMERDKGLVDGQLSDAEAALLEEMMSLRERVGELQKAHSLSAREVEELNALRNRVHAMNMRDDSTPSSNQHVLAPPPFASARCPQRLKEENMATACSENGREVEQLRNRVRELEAVDVSVSNDGRSQRHSQRAKKDVLHQMSSSAKNRHSQVLGELKKMRDRLKTLHNKTVETLTKENVDELMEIKDRILALQNEEAQLLNDPVTSPTSTNTGVSVPVTSPVATHTSQTVQSGITPRSKADGSSFGEVEVAKAENEQMRREGIGRSQSPILHPVTRFESSHCSSPASPGSTHVSAPPRYGHASDSSPGSPPAPPASVDPSTLSESSKLSHRMGLKKPMKALSAGINRMMGRRKEDPSEEEAFQTANEEVPNIVILNSLTHDQLMELLRAHHATCDAGVDFDEDPSSLMFGIEPAAATDRERVQPLALPPTHSEPAHPSQMSPDPHPSVSPRPRKPISEIQPRTERPPIVPPLMLSRLP